MITGTASRIELDAIAPEERAIRSVIGDLLEALKIPREEFDPDTLAITARSLIELTQGYRLSPDDVIGDALFDEASEEPILVRNISFVSICRDRLLPFQGVAHVGYLPGDRVVGLSKIARLVDLFAQRLQSPTRLSNQVSRAVMKYLDARGVAVRVETRQPWPVTSGITIARTVLGEMARPEWQDRLASWW